MKQAAYCIFETPIGACGIAWTDRNSSSAVTHFQLPEASSEITKSRIAQSSGGREASAPPADISAIIERIQKHLRGELQDFRDVAVDLSEVDTFARRVYEEAREIQAGQTRAFPFIM